MRYIIESMVHYFHSNQDDLVVCGKWLSATILLSIPSFMPEVEQWIRMVSVICGSVTAMLGMIIMMYKFKDFINKRHKTNGKD